MKDPVIIPKYLEKFQSGFTNSKTLKLDTSGHFPQEEQPEKVLNAIFDFLTEKKNHS
jgi:haloalkane dehalogenase